MCSFVFWIGVGTVHDAFFNVRVALKPGVSGSNLSSKILDALDPESA